MMMQSLELGCVIFVWNDRPCRESFSMGTEDEKIDNPQIDFNMHEVEMEFHLSPFVGSWV